MFYCRFFWCNCFPISTWCLSFPIYFIYTYRLRWFSYITALPHSVGDFPTHLEHEILLQQTNLLAGRQIEYLAAGARAEAGAFPSAENKSAWKGDCGQSWREFLSFGSWGNMYSLAQRGKSDCLRLLNEMSAFSPYTSGSQSALAWGPPQSQLPAMYFY